MAFLPNILKRKTKKDTDGMPHKDIVLHSQSHKERPRDARSSAHSGILLAPHLTEKATHAVHTNTYVFWVSRYANKIDVARAIRDRFHVVVQSVNILTTPEKERRRGRQIGWKPGGKKAMVTLHEGQTIEIQ